MTIRGNWTTNEVLTSDDLNDTVNDKISVSALGTASPLGVGFTADSAGTATDVSRVDHRHTFDPGLITVGEWSETTPTFHALTVGTGTAKQRYARFNKTIYAKLFLQFGSTTSVTGDFAWVLPILMNADIAYHAVGQAVVLDNDTGDYYTATVRGDTSNRRAFFYTSTSPSALMDATTPFTWATNDTIWAGVVYEAS